MARERSLLCVGLSLTAVLLIFLLAATSAPAVAGTAGQAKVDRLVMGLITPYLDYTRPWINGTADHNIQHDPMLEWLVEVDAETGTYKPWLAESWQMASDGRSWTLKLQKGVQYHHGYGEFTAQDVVHNHALWCDAQYPGRKDPPTAAYRPGICAVERIEVRNDHEIVMRCKVVCLDLLFYYSSAANIMMFSKKQWDAEGEMGYERKPAGTGPYIFKERELGRYVLYERAPTPHWKHGVMDWKEIQLTWTLEEATRFAQLLAGETHLTEVSKDLTDELVTKGYKLIKSRDTAQQVQINFGGLYFGTEDKATGRYTEHGGTTGKLDSSIPWTNIKVRQAMNKAINREELLRVLYKGRATPMYVAGFYPGLEGWDPSWEKRFPEMYGYDPVAAKRLLTEAGYPKGFKAKAWLFPFAGAPELVPLMEAAAIQLREVGIELELEEADWVAAVRPRLRDRKANNYLWAIPPSKKAVEPQLSVFNTGGLPHQFETDELYQMWRDLLQISDPSARDAQLRRIGTYKFEHFETIPLFNVFIEVIADPKIVADWPFPGWDGGDIGHTWRISACKQDKPCR
ncbi:MAG TPA: ABC transporter substrate-binding protein [Candidatus Tectomicrobia bacterium]|nr:ABC transporter substrate-binding protein [Candidatus Tectomicrobia bacterium]